MLLGLLIILNRDRRRWILPWSTRPPLLCTIHRARGMPWARCISRTWGVPRPGSVTSTTSKRSCIGTAGLPWTTSFFSGSLL
ncbi:hypothetical protein BDW72DRAFT_181068 [Aspergillus terricola var. indicus]